MGGAQSLPVEPSPLPPTVAPPRPASIAPAAPPARAMSGPRGEPGSSSTPATAVLKLASIDQWSAAYNADPKAQLASTFLTKMDMATGLTGRAVGVRDLAVFNHTVDAVGPVTNQLASGRCWLFATLNTIRIPLARKLKVDVFEFSQSYLFFYDSLHKANWFLEQMVDLAGEPIDSRTVQFMLVGPENDGGQFSMATNLIENVGLVPKALYPESWNSSNSGKLDGMLTSKLREFALELRADYSLALASLADDKRSFAQRRSIAMQSVRRKKETFLAQIYRILVISCGEPPKPTDKFTWEYKEMDGHGSWKVKTLSMTPLEFYKFSEFDMSGHMSLINDPRSPFKTAYTVDRLGNVVGGAPVSYVNAEISELKAAAISLIKDNLPCWFGCDVGKSSNMSEGQGVLDPDIYDLDLAFGTKLNLNKEQRLLAGDSAMTHAMVLTGVHLDKNGLPVRWRVENSYGPRGWGSVESDKGYMVMTDRWFDEFVYQVVAPKARVPKELVRIFEHGKQVVLPPWDAMGSLA